jgi:hypothetical protein
MLLKLEFTKNCMLVSNLTMLSCTLLFAAYTLLRHRCFVSGYAEPMQLLMLTTPPPRLWRLWREVPVRATAG